MVEGVSDSFFEDNRAGDGELWRIGLVDGDGSTNTRVKPLVAFVDSRTSEYVTTICWGQL